MMRVLMLVQETFTGGLSRSCVIRRGIWNSNTQTLWTISARCQSVSHLTVQQLCTTYLSAFSFIDIFTACDSLSCVLFITQRRSVAKSVGCFQRHLFVCLFVCQHDNLRTSKHRMMKLAGRRFVQKSGPSSSLGVIAPGCAPQKMWSWATMLGKSTQAF